MHVDRPCMPFAGGPLFAGGRPSPADFVLYAQINFFNETPEWDPLTGGHLNLAVWHTRMSGRASIANTTMESVTRLAPATI